MSSHRLLPALAVVLALTFPVGADGPGDNLADRVRPVPPKSTITLAEADRSGLQAGVDELGREIESLRGTLKSRPDLLGLLPDVQVFENAVRSAVTHHEIYRAREVSIARGLLERGRERARHLREGTAPWDTATGLVVRGYFSKIDGSVQPYGLVVPPSYRAARRRARSHCVPPRVRGQS